MSNMEGGGGSRPLLENVQNKDAFFLMSSLSDSFILWEKIHYYQRDWPTEKDLSKKLLPMAQTDR